MILLNAASSSMARNIFGSTKVASQGNLYHYYLPKGIVNLQITHSPTGFSVELASPSVDLLPDPDHNYFLRYTPNAFTHDEIQVSFSPQGFLKHVKTSIEDQRGEFISKVTDLASSIAQVAVAPVSTRSVDTIILHSGPFDPFNEAEVKELQAKMKEVDKSSSFEIKELGAAEQGSQDGGQSAEGGLGIYYRPLSTFSMTLNGSKGNSRTLLRLPHPQRVHFIEIPIASWVKTEFEIQFEEGGYPSNIHISKPSTALAMIQVPINIVAAILRLPGELFKFRIDLNSAKQNSLIREQELREQMVELEKRQDQFAAAQRVEAGTASRGLFDWVFRKKESPAPAPGGAAPSGNVSLPSDLDDQLKKMKQDIDVIRRRVNSMDK